MINMLAKCKHQASPVTSQPTSVVAPTAISRNSSEPVLLLDLLGMLPFSTLGFIELFRGPIHSHLEGHRLILHMLRKSLQPESACLQAEAALVEQLFALGQLIFDPGSKVKP